MVEGEAEAWAADTRPEDDAAVVAGVVDWAEAAWPGLTNRLRMLRSDIASR